MSTWYGAHDPFSKVGSVRLIVAKTNKTGYNWQGQLENCTHIIHVDAFDPGFVCPEKKNHKYGKSFVARTELNSEVYDNCEHQINHLFMLKENGIYEMIGDLYRWCSQSYDGDWDGESEIRNHRLRPIEFDSAECFDDKGALADAMVHLLSDGTKDMKFDEETSIHPYMDKQHILVNQANALTCILKGSYRSATNYRDIEIVDLENTIYMLVLQIDSERGEDVSRRALSVDEKTQEVLLEHEKLMVEDDFDKEERLKASSESK